MGFILLLRSNWKLLAIVTLLVFDFISGWHLRGAHEAIKEAKALNKEIVLNNKIATGFENTTANINKETDNLNKKLKVIYAEDGDCALSANELRVLQ